MKKKNDREELVFVGAVLDNVHGFIHYTKTEEKIINTHLFRRLQSIKQLSVVNWVFPGSEHTRYIHSLGVMHVADKIAVALGLTVRERKVLRLAGLLHDIGHYPLSHVGEKPYLTNAALKQIDEKRFCAEINQKVVDKIRDFKIKEPKDPMSPSQAMHHEWVGAEIVRHNREIRSLVEAELWNGAADLIAKMIIGSAEGVAPGEELLVQILHSELDADGIDYMMRDSAFAGTSYGAGEIDQLIRCMRIGWYQGKRILCIDPRGVPAADQYILNKFFHYSQVVFNRHIVVSEWMAEQVILWLRRNSSVFPTDGQLKDWIQRGATSKKYLKFTDNRFWFAVERISSLKASSGDTYYLPQELCRKNNKKKQVPKYIRVFCQHLMYHDEPDAAMGHEIRVVSRESARIREELQQSVTFQTAAYHTTWFTVLESRTMTKQMPMADIDAKARNAQLALLAPGDPAPDADFSHRVNWFMECICVADYPELEKAADPASETDGDVRMIPRSVDPVLGGADQDGNLKLLCDYHRSLMWEMYSQTVAILRSYEFPK